MTDRSSKIYMSIRCPVGKSSKILRPHTVFLVGRKGTGKSTIFQRAQHEIRKKSTSTSAYVDIKTVYEQSEIDTPLLDKLDQTDLALPKDAVRRFLLYKAFLLL